MNEGSEQVKMLENFLYTKYTSVQPSLRLLGVQKFHPRDHHFRKCQDKLTLRAATSKCDDMQSVKWRKIHSENDSFWHRLFCKCLTELAANVSEEDAARLSPAAEKHPGAAPALCASLCTVNET